MKVHLYYQQQFGNWVHYQTKHNKNDAYRVAKLKSKQMSKRFKLTDDDGRVLDLIDPFFCDNTLKFCRELYCPSGISVGNFL